MKKVFHIILFICVTFSCVAQDKNNSQFWVQVGTGITFMKLTDTDAGINFAGSLNYEKDNDNFSFSFINSIEWILFSNPEEYIKSYMLQYGRSINFTMRGLFFPLPFFLLLKDQFNYSLVGKMGISYNESIKRTTIRTSQSFSSYYNHELITGFGLPIDVEFREEISSYFGMGLSAFANFNKVRNYSGFNISLHLGQF